MLDKPKSKVASLEIQYLKVLEEKQGKIEYEIQLLKKV